MSTTELPPLVARLMTEADQCRNDGADDIARLLDEAVRELQGLQVEAFAGQSGQGHLGALVDDLRSEIKALHVTEQNLREQLAARVPDEREAFENWAKSRGKDARDLERSSAFRGQYTWRTEQQMWEAWQARASLASSPQPVAQPEQPAVQGEPVAWMVYQGVCQYQLCGSEKHAKAVAAQNQKDHDLSGSLAHFHVKPLYTHPQPERVAMTDSDAFNAGFRAGYERRDMEVKGALA